MDISKYGPFANVVALAAALVAVFGALLFKSLGRLTRWSWLAGDSPTFLVAAGARIFAVALMAVTYVTINGSNYHWFGMTAVVSGALGFFSVSRFNGLRKLHVASIPLVGSNGQQLFNEHGQPLVNNVVIGTEDQLRSDAKAALKNARKSGGVSLLKFMSGHGDPVNDPETLWDRGVLAGIANNLTTTLMYVVLSAVMTLFLAALVIDVAGRNGG